MTSTEFVQLRGIVNRLQQILAHTINDLSLTTPPSGLIYNLDFSVLFPYLFRESPEGTPPFRQYRGDILRSVFALLEMPGNPARLRLGFTGPSFLELLDQVEHRREEYGSRLEHLSSLCDRWAHAAEQNQDELLSRSGPVMQRLDSVLSGKFHDDEIVRAVRIMESLVSKGLLTPIGDLLGGKAELKANYITRYERAFVSIKAARQSRDNRSPEDADFHYKVDSLNAVLSGAIEPKSGYRVMFATPQKENIRQCVSHNDSFGRHPLVPLFMLNATQLERSGSIGSGGTFLKSVLRRAVQASEAMGKSSSLEDMPDWEVEEAVRLYQDLSRLSSSPLDTEGAPGVAPRAWSKEEAVRFLGQPGLVKQMARKVDADMVQLANELVASFHIDRSLGELADLEEDPVVRKIKTNLKLP